MKRSPGFLFYKHPPCVGRLFFICIPQIFKPFVVLLRWGGQEDAVFTVILCGGGGPVIGTRHHTPIIKDGEFIMFNLVLAVDADGYAGEYGWHVDHIHPKALGGLDNIRNLQPLHWKENLEKGKNILIKKTWSFDHVFYLTM